MRKTRHIGFTDEEEARIMAIWIHYNQGAYGSFSEALKFCVDKLHELTFDDGEEEKEPKSYLLSKTERCSEILD